MDGERCCCSAIDHYCSSKWIEMDEILVVQAVYAIDMIQDVIYAEEKSIAREHLSKFLSGVSGETRT